MPVWVTTCSTDDTDHSFLHEVCWRGGNRGRAAQLLSLPEPAVTSLTRDLISGAPKGR